MLDNRSELFHESPGMQNVSHIVHPDNVVGVARLDRSNICCDRYTNTTEYVHSPNSLRTLLNTLSFSGSYGWSLDGISSTAGNAS